MQQPPLPKKTPAHDMGFATRAIHEGYDERDEQGALIPPVYMTSTFAFENVEQGSAMFAGETPGHFYSRISNPTLDLLERRFASLENAEAAVSFSSGMGAISSVMWTLLQQGDEIITDKTLYGCTFAFMRTGLKKFGVTLRHVDMKDPDNLAREISSKTRIVYFETPANPNMRLVDIEVISGIARAHGAKTVVDNTYATPYLTRPLDRGADIVVHSATKYLGGHGDLVAGIAAGSLEDMTAVRMEGLKDMTGAVMAPLTAFHVMRGMKTLELRMDRHCSSAMMIAEALESHPAVGTVHYPGLPSSPQHELAKRQMTQFGGMIAFELVSGFDAGVRMMNALKLIKRAVSLGDADTLIQHPASMTHSVYTPEERAEHEISDGLIRLSVGLETPADILADLTQALDQVQTALKRTG